jgi:hypothetical protein
MRASRPNDALTLISPAISSLLVPLPMRRIRAAEHPQPRWRAMALHAHKDDPMSATEQLLEEANAEVDWAEVLLAIPKLRQELTERYHGKRVKLVRVAGQAVNALDHTLLCSALMARFGQRCLAASVRDPLTMA